MPRSQRDDYYLLSRKQQAVLVRLRTGHNRLSSHLHGKLKLASSRTCPCGQEDQTTEHVLQRCPLHKGTRDVWPDNTLLTTKLCGCISRAALIVSTANAKKKKKPKWQNPKLCHKHSSTYHSLLVGCLLACLTFQQHASVSQGRICEDNCTCCHTEIEVADQTFHLTQSWYTGTRPISPSADPITPSAWQGSHWSAVFCGFFWFCFFQVTGMTRPRKIPSHLGFELRIFRSRGGRLDH